MEKQSKNTRFCLICNYISRSVLACMHVGPPVKDYCNRIIEPLTSRCSKFRFKPLSVDVLKSRLEHIVKEENVSCDEAVIDTVISASQGDLRKAITLLQSASHLKGPDGVTDQDIIEIAGVSCMNAAQYSRVGVSTFICTPTVPCENKTTNQSTITHTKVP